MTIFYFPDNQWIEIGLMGLLGLEAMRIIYWVLSLKILTKSQTTVWPDFLPPVSVVIAARNEATNLERFLPEILQQDYPEYEVIVVNHASIDHTDDVLKRLSQRYKHLVIRTLKNDSLSGFGKKLPLTLGIKAARYDYILLTDADCRPASPQWIKKMVAPLQTKHIVLGYGGFEKRMSFVNRLVRYDTVQNAMLYLSTAVWGKPYMGVGRNLAYRKSVFFEAKGFAGHAYLPSGDDDLLINQMATRQNTAVLMQPETFTYSKPVLSLKEWLHAKSRHLTTSVHYSLLQQLYLAFENLVRFSFLPLAFFLIACNLSYFFYPLLLILLDVAMKYFLLKKIYRLFKEQDILVYSIIFDIIAPLLIAILLFVNRFKKHAGK